ncbi:MAG: hypothetical protein LBJ80_00990 [Rickettsiales bacterium]|jgi:hypothetical protein|nr:hypothetical protein [Rickettsiales bacterium]MDR1260987.1 hypothetical protein [Rickettsiales bacterium]
MGAIKISKFLFSRSNKITKQYDELTVEKNLYTILGFKSGEDFEDKTSKLFNNDEKQLKKLQDKLWHRFEKKIKGDKGNNKAAKNINNTIKESKTTGSKLDSLLEFKKQLQSFLKDQNDQGIVLNAINPASAARVIEVSGIYPKERDIKKLKKAQPLTSNKQDFEDALGYIESQEKAIGITLEELREYKKNSIKIFLLDYTNPLKKKHPKSHGKREDAISILSSNELKNFYDKSIEEGVLQPMASYKECKNLYDRMNQMENESKGMIERKERKENLKEIGKSIVKTINDIKKYREAILNCKHFQNSYIKEKEEHPFRGKSCQKMVDIYQERIAGYQEKICQNLTQIREIFKGMPQETRSLCGVEEFEESMDNMHEAKQVDENFDSALSNIQNKLDTQLERTENPSTELEEALHVKSRTEVTRL